MEENDYLRQPLKPVEIRERMSVNELVGQLSAYQGKNLAIACDIFGRMLDEKDLTIFMGFSGAMVPAGMRSVMTYLIRKHYIDCLVSTGANLFHDCHEALGFSHYVGTHLADDNELYKHSIDRIYDVYASEKQFRITDHFMMEAVKSLGSEKAYSTAEFLSALGKELRPKAKNDSILVAAYEEKIPIFCPAIGDSSLMYVPAIEKMKGNPSITIDAVKDVAEICELAKGADKTGVIYVGGGTPKNYVQQIEMILSVGGIEKGGHEYAIQITTDSPQWGGLSGCTLEEAQSWGKIAEKAKKVMVYCDATIALPILTASVAEKRAGAPRVKP